MRGAAHALIAAAMMFSSTVSTQASLPRAEHWTAPSDNIYLIQRSRPAPAPRPAPRAPPPNIRPAPAPMPAPRPPSSSLPTQRPSYGGSSGQGSRPGLAAPAQRPSVAPARPVLSLRPQGPIARPGQLPSIARPLTPPSSIQRQGAGSYLAQRAAGRPMAQVRPSPVTQQAARVATYRQSSAFLPPPRPPLPTSLSARTQGFQQTRLARSAGVAVVASAAVGGAAARRPLSQQPSPTQAACAVKFGELDHETGSFGMSVRYMRGRYDVAELDSTTVSTAEQSGHDGVLAPSRVAAVIADAIFDPLAEDSPLQLLAGGCGGSGGGLSRPTLGNQFGNVARPLQIAISLGHSYPKHVIRDGQWPGYIRTRKQLASHVATVVSNPSDFKRLSDGRTAYWHNESRTVVILDPKRRDGGTVFQPREGKTYFETLDK